MDLRSPWPEKHRTRIKRKIPAFAHNPRKYSRKRTYHSARTKRALLVLFVLFVLFVLSSMALKLLKGG